MSGGIKIAANNYWGASGWCYQTIVDEIIAVLGDTQRCPALLEYLRDPSEAPQVVSYVDLRSRPVEELAAFREAVTSALDRFKQKPDFPVGYLEHYKKLIEQLDDPRDTQVA